MQLEPEENDVVRDLQPVIDHIGRIMESALDDAINYYRDKKRSINVQTVPDLVRDNAKHLLEQHPLPEQPYELEDLSRNGLSLFCRGYLYEMYHIKILKGDLGTLSATGISSRKECFLCQQLPLWLALHDLPSSDASSNVVPLRKSAASRKMLNLVFTWDVDLKTGMLFLSLACPKGVKADRVVTYWDRRIEHAALRIAQEVAQPVYVEDPDYGITLPVLGKLGNGQEDD